LEIIFEKEKGFNFEAFYFWAGRERGGGWIFGPPCGFPQFIPFGY